MVSVIDHGYKFLPRANRCTNIGEPVAFSRQDVDFVSQKVLGKVFHRPLTFVDRALPLLFRKTVEQAEQRCQQLGEPISYQDGGGLLQQKSSSSELLLFLWRDVAWEVEAQPDTTSACDQGSGRTLRGFTYPPGTRTSKCRCGPEEFPVLPERPISLPFSTFAPQ